MQPPSYEVHPLLYKEEHLFLCNLQLPTLSVRRNTGYKYLRVWDIDPFRVPDVLSVASLVSLTNLVHRV